MIRIGEKVLGQGGATYLIGEIGINLIGKPIRDQRNLINPNWHRISRLARC